MAKLNLSPETLAKLRQVANADVFGFLGFKPDLTTWRLSIAQSILKS